MRRWSEDDFEDDWTGPPHYPLINQIPVAEQPRALVPRSSRALVAPSTPGSRSRTSPSAKTERPRTARSGRTSAGSTRASSRPATSPSTWPCRGRRTSRSAAIAGGPRSARTDIVTEAQYTAVVKSYDQKLDGPLATALANRDLWTRDLPQAAPDIDNQMITAWRELGFVLPRTGPDNQIVYVESGARHSSATTCAKPSTG